MPEITTWQAAVVYLIILALCFSVGVFVFHVGLWRDRN